MSENNDKGLHKSVINWDSLIYPKIHSNPYKIRNYQKWVFAYYIKMQLDAQINFAVLSIA